jgi:uncharacterized phage protein (TIGR02216 family)
MKMGMGAMQIQPSEFWRMTFKDFWAIYESRFGHLPEKMTKADLAEMLARNPD